jgi:hypothetical protein
MLRRALLAALLAAVGIAGAPLLRAQEPAAPAPPPPPGAESSSQPSGQAKSSHADDFLVRGTVFTPEGLAMPGVELRIRRSSEKKFRWDTVSNSRGEFAVRVKMGSAYEVTIHAKGYQPLTETVDAKTGERSKELVFHMQRQEGKKS